MQRAPKGYTYDPCPGCGMVHDHAPRPRSGVCHECASVLKDAAKRKSECADKGKVCAMLPSRHHWLPHISSAPDALQRAFLGVAVAVSEVGGMNEFPLLDGGRLVTAGTHEWLGSWAEDGRTFSLDAALALRELYAVLLDVVPAAYQAGKRDGSNLLAMLNSGELTNTDFERRAGISTPR